LDQATVGFGYDTGIADDLRRDYIGALSAAFVPANAIDAVHVAAESFIQGWMVVPGSSPGAYRFANGNLQSDDVDRVRKALKQEFGKVDASFGTVMGTFDATAAFAQSVVTAYNAIDTTTPAGVATKTQIYYMIRALGCLDPPALMPAPVNDQQSIDYINQAIGLWHNLTRPT
jgi:hypothetical protein